MGKKYILGLRGKALRNAQIWAVILPAYLLFGYNNAVAGPLLDLPSWVATFPRIDTVNTTGAQNTSNSRVQGTVVAMYTLGAFFGALSCIYIGDKLGRVRTIQLGAGVTVIGSILQSSSYSLAQLIVGRLVRTQARNLGVSSNDIVGYRTGFRRAFGDSSQLAERMFASCASGSSSLARERLHQCRASRLRVAKSWNEFHHRLSLMAISTGHDQLLRAHRDRYRWTAA